MASIPKAAKQGGKGRSSGAKFLRAGPRPGVSVPSDRGGRRIGPTRCTARGRHSY